MTSPAEPEPPPGLISSPAEAPTPQREGPAPQREAAEPKPETLAAKAEALEEEFAQHMAEVNKKAGRNIYAAVPAAVVLIAIVVVALIWANWLLALFVAVLLAGGMWELHRGLRDHHGVRATIAPALAGGVLTLAAAYLAGWAPAAGQLCDWFGFLPCTASGTLQVAPPGTVLAGGLALTSAACLAWRLRRGVEGYIKDATASLALVAYCALLGGTLVLMLLEPQGPFRVGFFVLVIVGSDTGGYLMGLAFGRHHLAPTISKGKTWEGALGSLILAPVAGLVVVAIGLNLAWWQAVIAAEVIAVAGMLGDLVESAIKRDLGVKDLGTIIPGHGGIMDRVDSYLLAAPVGYLTLALLVA
jgi:phosphatidate cytidylyltransferase